MTDRTNFGRELVDGSEITTPKTPIMIYLDGSKKSVVGTTKRKNATVSLLDTIKQEMDEQRDEILKEIHGTSTTTPTPKKNLTTASLKVSIKEEIADDLKEAERKLFREMVPKESTKNITATESLAEKVKELVEKRKAEEENREKEARKENNVENILTKLDTAIGKKEPTQMHEDKQISNTNKINGESLRHEHLMTKLNMMIGPEVRNCEKYLILRYLISL